MNDFEGIPCTWANILKIHYEGFNDFLWKAFNNCVDKMNDFPKDHPDSEAYFYKFREYVLWDMQKKHKINANTNSTFKIVPTQTCTHCENPDSILTKDTCCTGCSKLDESL